MQAHPTEKRLAMATAVGTTFGCISFALAGYMFIINRKSQAQNVDLQNALTKSQATLTAIPPTFTPGPTGTPSPTETIVPTPTEVNWNSEFDMNQMDRNILAEIGNLHKQPKWQEVLAKADDGYETWTGIAVLDPKTGKYAGIFADGNFHQMPESYTPENNPITQAAWPDRVFPPGYFMGTQPLNAPEMVNGRPTRSEHVPITDRNSIPADIVIVKGSQVLLAQGSRVELDNDQQFFDENSVFVISFDANLHGHFTKGEYDKMWLPEGLTPDAQRLIGLTWLNGVRASTAEWQPDVHGGDYNHADTFEVEGDANRDLIVNPLWLNPERSSMLEEIGNQISVSSPAIADMKKDPARYTVDTSILPHHNSDPISASIPFAATVFSFIGEPVPDAPVKGQGKPRTKPKRRT